jgi:hypothetical protein
MTSCTATGWRCQNDRRHAPRRRRPPHAYRDAVGDLFMDVAGAALGAITLWLTGRAASAFDR